MGHDRATIRFQTDKHSGTDRAKHVDKVSNYLMLIMFMRPRLAIGTSLMNTLLIFRM